MGEGSPSGHAGADDSAQGQPEGRSRWAFTTQLRWPWPRRGTLAPHSPSSVPVGSYVITLVFAEVRGRLECVRFEIEAAEDDPTSPDLQPVTASALRGVPLGELIDEALFRHTKELRRWANQAGPAGPKAKSLRVRVAAAELSLPRAPGRPALYSEDHFKRVADAYTRAWRIGGHPREAVARRWHVSPSTAAKWVARARDMGFLPPTERGRPRGGQAGGDAPDGESRPPPLRSKMLQDIERMEAAEAVEAQVLHRHEAWLATLGVPQASPAGTPQPAERKRSGERGEGAGNGRGARKR